MTARIIEQLNPIFSPRSLAVIGASSVPFKWGFQTIQRLIATGYQGAIYPVNPTEKEIQGLTAYPGVLDIPDEVDLAVMAVRAELIPQAMRHCVEKGIRGAIIISADFAETGDHGRALQKQVTDIAREGGLRFVGPNCFGIWNAASRMNTLPVVPPEGDIAFISQSGSQTHLVARVAATKGYGLSKIISVGNQADLDVADYLEYLTADPDTKAVCIYLEGFKDGRKLFGIAREMAGKKPVVVYKTGKNPGSARVAMSHTAALIGEDRVFDAMCRQVGFLRADNMFATLDMAAALTRQPLPRGKRVGIQGTGGQCMIATDTCLSLGMEVPELEEDQVSFLISDMDFPPHAPAPKNPVDLAGTHTALMDATIINRLAQLPTIDGIISYRPITFNLADEPTSVEQEKLDSRVGELIAAVPQEYAKPLVLIDASSLTGDEFLAASETLSRAIEAAGIMVCSTPEEAARTMHTLVEYAKVRRRFTEAQTAN
ncbi:acetate--CoA ligase family protein [Thermodesulfobacteriota bacterium]